MTTRPRRILTDRDLEVFQALDHTPLTAGQLLKISGSFRHRFGSERMVRERLAALAAAGWVRAARYATTGSGAGQYYYQLTRTGFAIVNGASAEPPTKRFFAPVSLARQHHTRSLADFVVHTITAAHEAGVAFTDYFRENTLRLQVGEECLYPDCAFRLVLSGERAFNYFVELDNHSEQIRSTRDADSWQKKARLYDALQAESAERFRVLVITTRSGPRLKHILSLAAATAGNPQRSLFLGAPLAEYVAQRDPLRAAVFLDHHLRHTGLLAAPVVATPPEPSRVRGIGVPAAVC